MLRAPLLSFPAAFPAVWTLNREVAAREDSGILLENRLGDEHPTGHGWTADCRPRAAASDVPRRAYKLFEKVVSIALHLPILPKLHTKQTQIITFSETNTPDSRFLVDPNSRLLVFAFE